MKRLIFNYVSDPIGKIIVAAWASNSPERAVAVGNGLLNAGTDFVWQVIDDGLANVDLGRVAVSFGEGYLTGMVAAYAPRATTVLGRDNHGHE